MGDIMIISDIFIPSEVADFLWFIDGEHKNYEPPQNADYDASHIEYIDFDDEDFDEYDETYEADREYPVEPSVISLDLPIMKPKKPLFVNVLGYYPTYRSMIPEQRWIYINWLTNINDVRIDIGYVFLFYYGLERHLFSDNFENAFKMIRRMRKYHKNKLFLYHSSTALLASLLYYERVDLFTEWRNDLNETLVYDVFPNFFLHVIQQWEQPLLPKEVVRLSKMVGFTNQRYIDSHYDMFLSILTEKIKMQFGHEFIPYEYLDLNVCRTEHVSIVANGSLMLNRISIPIFDVNNAIFMLLDDTHESVKSILKEQRKNKKY
jgi:hypothetical protein